MAFFDFCFSKIIGLVIFVISMYLLNNKQNVAKCNNEFWKNKSDNKNNNCRNDKSNNKKIINYKKESYK